jgi:broad specificity phosphatase PhoE
VRSGRQSEAAAKNWGTEQRDAAVSVYSQVRDQGPAAVMSPAPSAQEDAATIARASELLHTDPELQEA